ncbi:MAG: LysE family translocator, partial [Vicinamibacterales bacterium]
EGGHRAGLAAALGAALANSTHATLAGLGLWALVGRWPAALDAIRLGGAAYLAWLGLKSLARVWPHRVTPPAPARADGAPGATGVHHPSFVEGLTLNLLNPAVISFYVAVVPTFVPAPPPRFYFAALAATHVSMALACHSAWATAFHVLRRIFARPVVRVGFELTTAAALLWLAARVVGRL